MTAYRFRPATREDLPMLRRWLRTPEVVRWWGDPDEQAALLEGDLIDPRMAMSVVAFDGRPFAYPQDYDLHAWPQHHFAHLPRESRGVDCFIGDPAMIGAGHGSAFVRLLARRLCSVGAPMVAVDPDPDNLRVRRAYGKAGFFGDTMVETEYGPAVLMTFPRADHAADRHQNP